MRTLKEIGTEYGTDKVTFHGYEQYYEMLFGQCREQRLSLLEIGVWHGASLMTWREYFPNAQIFGLDHDVQPFASGPYCKLGDSTSDVLIGPGFSVYRGAQDDTAALDRVGGVAECFDVIIDDGSHVADQQLASFRHLFPRYLKCGGMYVIEDLNQRLSRPHDSPIMQQPGAEVLGRLCGHLLVSGIAFWDVQAIHCYPKIVFIQKANQ